MNETLDNSPLDDEDTEGHMPTIRKIDHKVDSLDDVEGHRFVPADERLPVGDLPNDRTAD